MPDLEIEITPFAFVLIPAGSTPLYQTDGDQMAKLLIADDFGPLRTSLKKYFEARGLGTCLEAENGREALRLAEQLRPDVVIMDYSMPVMNGLDAARAVHQALPNVPIFLITAHGATVRRFLGDVPINGLFMKDNLVPLLNAVRSHLESVICPT
jgi:CheY-like chemotaxis protein